MTVFLCLGELLEVRRNYSSFEIQYFNQMIIFKFEQLSYVGA